MVEMLRLPGAGHIETVTGRLEARLAQNEGLLNWMRRYLM